MALQEAGLTGRVRVGVPLPLEETSAPSGSSTSASLTPGAEECAFPPDALLRPTVRPERGRLVELSGEISSGCTSLACRRAAGTTGRGELVAWIDLPNALDPRYLLRAGVDLGSVLWVRPPDVRAALRSAELLLETGFTLVAIDLDSAPARALERLGPPVWLRLLRAVRESRATALLLGAQRIAGSFSSQLLYTERERALFDRGLFEGLECRATLLRDRGGPPGRVLPLRLAHRA